MYISYWLSEKMLYMSPFACTYLFIFRIVDYFSFLSSCDNIKKGYMNEQKSIYGTGIYEINR